MIVFQRDVHSARMRALEQELLSVPKDESLEFLHETAAAFVARGLEEIRSNTIQRIWSADDGVLPLRARMTETTFLAEFLYRFILSMSIMRLGANATGPIALVAQGSFARRELIPSSDFDGCLIIYDLDQQSEAIIFIHHITSRVFSQPARILPQVDQISFSANTQAECKHILALLESRFVGGESILWRTWRTDFFLKLKRNWPLFVQTLRLWWRTREESESFFDTARDSIFDLKESRGGMREFQMLLWIGEAYVILEANGIRALAELHDIPELWEWQALERCHLVSSPEALEMRAIYNHVRAVRAQIRARWLFPSEYSAVAEHFGFSSIDGFLDDLEQKRERLFAFARIVLFDRIDGLQI